MQTKDFYVQVSPNVLKCTTCWLQQLGKSPQQHYKYKPKAVKLQGRIPFRQSCCKKCQNFENINNEAAKYLCGVPHNTGDCNDQSMCSYTGYFPKIQCILHTCDDCGVDKFKAKIVAANRGKLSDARKRFLVKLWITKTERKGNCRVSLIGNLRGVAICN